MCDTFVILGEYTQSGKTLFGKNSDRDPDEVQNIIFQKGSKHTENEQVKCTYLSIPQVEQTYDVILSKPFWMFGAEMGVNQFGLTIGNEAVFTSEPLREIGLTGMDMIRLALERKKTAKDALNYIISLIEKYGQGGGCGYHDRSESYHNSWIIADPNEAYVLESADKFWVWKKVKKNYSISNILTIEDNFDGISSGAIRYAIDNGRCHSESDFSFRKAFMARGLNMISLKNIGAKGDERRKLHYNKVCSKIDNENANILSAMEVLRSHNKITSLFGLIKSYEEYSPDKGSMGDVCMHSGLSLFRPSQSVNSLIVYPSENISEIWTTCGSSPCIQLYRPLVLYNNGVNSIPESIIPGDANYDENTTWWKNEKLHRLVLKDYIFRLEKYKEERDSIEKNFIEKYQAIKNRNPNNLVEFCEKSFNNAQQAIDKWIEKIKNLPVQNGMKSNYIKKWNLLNEKNGLRT